MMGGTPQEIDLDLEITHPLTSHDGVVSGEELVERVMPPVVSSW